MNSRTFKESLTRTFVMKFKDFQAPVLFSSTFKALNLGEKNSKDFQGCVEPCKSPRKVNPIFGQILASCHKQTTLFTNHDYKSHILSATNVLRLPARISPLEIQHGGRPPSWKMIKRRYLRIGLTDRCEIWQCYAYLPRTVLAVKHLNS